MAELGTVIDGFFAVCACISAGFLAYGAWLCVAASRPAKSDARKKVPASGSSALS